MKTRRAFLLALVLLAAPVAVRAQFTYTTNNGAITLAHYAGSGGDVVVSNFVNIIGYEAFYQCSSLTTVTIPGSVTNIGVDGFLYCSSLTSIEFMGNAPTTTGNVSYPLNATVYYLPGTTGWSNTFGGLSAVLFPYTFTTNAGTTTVTGYAGSGGAVGIPAVIYGLPVTGIGTNAFSGWGNLNIVAIPGSVTNIAAGAFSCCSNLMGVYFGSNAPATDATAFASDGNATVYYCAGSTGWSSPFAGLPAAVVQSQYYTCATNATNAGTLTITGYSGPSGSVAIPAALNGVLVTSIGQSAFQGTGLTSVIIPGSVISIANNAFASCTSLGSVTISGSVTNIGLAAFASCTNLTSVDFGGNSPLGSSSFTFFRDPAATVYYLPGATGWSNTFGGVPAFMIPYTFTTNAGMITITGYLGSGAAVAMPALINGLPVTSIGTNVFSACGSLATVAIPGSVTNIAADAFSGCTNLIGVYFGSNAPATDATAFASDVNATVYYCAGSIGWSSPFEGLPAVAVQDQYYTCATNGTGITISGYTGPSGAVTIPAAINGLLVTAIGSGAFEGTSLTSVVIPGGVACISNLAFFECSNLTSVTIPGSVTAIGVAAFNLCSGLASVEIGGNAPMAAANTFVEDTNAVIYYFPGTTGWSNTYCGVPAVLVSCTFVNNGGTVAITGYAGSGQYVDIPPTINGLSVTSVGDGAFDDCASLTCVIIPASVTNIGSSAFCGCSNLACLYFLGNSPAVGSGALTNDNIATAYYSPGTTGWNSSLGGIAAGPATAPSRFVCSTGAGGITINGYTGPSGSVVIPPVINGWQVTSIGGNAFSNLTSVTILPGVTNISAGAFNASYYLTSVTIPASVTNIGSGAFASCISLLSVYSQGNAPSVGSGVFQNGSTPTVYYLTGANGWGSTFSGLPTVAIQEQNQLLYETAGGGITINRYVGPGGPVAIPAAINSLPATGIGTNAFVDTSVTSVSIPAFVTNIAVFAFCECYDLAAMAVDPNSSFFSSLNGVLFDKSQDTLVAFPGGMGGSYAIPGSVASIGAGAFCWCTNLTSVTIPGTVTNIGHGAFESCLGLTRITIPGGVTNIGDYAFYFCSRLTNATLGASVGYVGASAFTYCTSLRSVYFEGNEPAVGTYCLGGGLYPYVDPATVYYPPGATGWGSSFAGRPTVLWNPLIQTGDGDFGVQNGQFGFNTTGTSGIAIVIEACTNLACPVWVAVQTNTLTSGSCCFSEPMQAGSPGRFYRIRSP